LRITPCALQENPAENLAVLNLFFIFFIEILEDEFILKKGVKNEDKKRVYINEGSNYSGYSGYSGSYRDTSVQPSQLQGKGSKPVRRPANNALTNRTIY
jgi:hypothetical protein